MTWNLFIDDERNLSDVTWATNETTFLYHTEPWSIARNMLEVAQLVAEKGMPKFVSFDHDLGHNEKTGYDIAAYLVQLDMDRERDLFGDVIEFAKDFQFCVHSMNPVGRENIMRYLENYLEFKHE